MVENELAVAIDNALFVARANKPNDRSDLDRRYAIAITELEKVVAYAIVFLGTKEAEEE